jgi:hypothetical protein
MPYGPPSTSVKSVISQKKTTAKATAKAKTNITFPSQIAETRVFEIAAFLLPSNIRIRRAKNFSRGRLKKYFG